jgi:hypothetical protein
LPAKDACGVGEGASAGTLADGVGEGEAAGDGSTASTLLAEGDGWGEAVGLANGSAFIATTSWLRGFKRASRQRNTEKAVRKRTIVIRTRFLIAWERRHPCLPVRAAHTST